MNEISANEGTLRFAEKLLGLLDWTKTTATYKYAVLLGLMDLCLEHTGKYGDAPTMLTTHQLAEKVLALYWPHTVPHHGRPEVLRQTPRGRRESSR